MLAPPLAIRQQPDRWRLYIERLAGAIGRTRDETLDVLREWYNGYRFAMQEPTVYNPVSVMLDDGHPITLIGVEFAQATRNLGAHRIEALDAGTGGQVRETPAAYAADVAGKPSTRESDRREIARRMQAKGIAPEIIAEVTGVSP